MKGSLQIIRSQQQQLCCLISSFASNFPISQSSLSQIFTVVSFTLLVQTDDSTPVVVVLFSLDFLPACLNLVQTDTKHSIKTVCSSQLCCDCSLCSLCHETCRVQNHTGTFAAILHYKLIIPLQLAFTLHNFLTLISVFVSSIEVSLFLIFPFHKCSLLVMQDAYYYFMSGFLHSHLFFSLFWSDIFAALPSSEISLLLRHFNFSNLLFPVPNH